MTIGGSNKLYTIKWVDRFIPEHIDIEIRWMWFMRFGVHHFKHKTGGGIDGFYFGPFWFAKHWLPKEELI